MSIVYTAKDPRKELLETAAKIMAGMYSNQRCLEDSKKDNRIEYIAGHAISSAATLIKHVNKYFNK